MVGADVVGDRPHARLLDHCDGLAVQPDVFADQFGSQDVVQGRGETENLRISSSSSLYKKPYSPDICSTVVSTLSIYVQWYERSCLLNWKTRRSWLAAIPKKVYSFEAL